MIDNCLRHLDDDKSVEHVSSTLVATQDTRERIVYLWRLSGPTSWSFCIAIDTVVDSTGSHIN